MHLYMKLSTVIDVARYLSPFASDKICKSLSLCVHFSSSQFDVRTNDTDHHVHRTVNVDYALDSSHTHNRWFFAMRDVI